MKNVQTFDQFLNEEYDTAFNTNQLKYITFILGPWDSVDKKGKKNNFRIAFNDKVNRKDIDKAIYRIVKEKDADKAVGDMDIEWISDDFNEDILEISKVNYAGLTYIFKALDSLYGKYGASMGWEL